MENKKWKSLFLYYIFWLERTYIYESFLYFCLTTVCLKVCFMDDKYKIPYLNACIRAFAQRFSLSVKSAFLYLHRFKGIHFLDEYYEVEHLQSLDDAVDDLIVLCHKNGGMLQ